jgi:hypothetical protein
MAEDKVGHIMVKLDECDEEIFKLKTAIKN